MPHLHENGSSSQAPWHTHIEDSLSSREKRMHHVPCLLVLPSSQLYTHIPHAVHDVSTSLSPRNVHACNEWNSNMLRGGGVKGKTSQEFLWPTTSARK